MRQLTISLILCCAFAGTSLGAEFDVLIRGGIVVDGTGSPGQVADVGIVGDRIAAVGDLSDASAELEIEAKGRHVAPGFIDLHNHADRNIGRNPDVANYLFQGVTSILTGNCGMSPADVGQWFDDVGEKGVGPNVAILIGHNAVRREVMGNEDRAPTEDEQRRMEALVHEAMEQGTFGMSTGLTYLPGTYSETEEIIGLASVVSEWDGLYASHMRSEFSGIGDAIDEAIRIGEEAGVPVHISHFKVADNAMWGQSTMTLGKVSDARKAGLDVTVDQYPYTAASTGLTNLIPAWARAGSREDFQARLDDPEMRARIKTEVIDILNGPRAAGDLSRVTIASYKRFPEYVGKTLAEVTELRGYEPTIPNGAEVAMELLYEARGSAIYHMMTEEDVRRIMQSPFTAIASDGSAVDFDSGVPHLRNYGAFPRVLRRYVVEEKLLTLEEAIHKMTLMPADRIGLHDRGRIAAGLVADVVVFDLERVRDFDDWAKPHRYAEGFDYVFVAGQAVIADGKQTGARPGRLLRKTDFAEQSPAH